MPRSMPPTVLLLLSFVAGYVDSSTFLALFGLFVAQVTGSSVLIGVQPVRHAPEIAMRLAGILGFFLGGVATTVVARRVDRRGPYALPAAFALEAVLLTGLLASWLVGRPLQTPDQPAALSASLLGLAAMGVQSAVVRLLAQGSPSTNVMTTNTTQLAIDITDLVLARWPRQPAPADTKATREYAETKGRLSRLWPVILAFLLGTVAGGVAYARIDLWCLLLAIGVIGALSAWAQRAA